MSSQFWAKSVGIGRPGGRRFTSQLAIGAILVAIAVSASGCMQATAKLAGADPADPAAKVASVGYRSTIAPYQSLRPATPAPWRERNDSVTSKSRQESQ
jgi:hypothetical protein